MRRLNTIHRWLALVAIALIFGACASSATHTLEDYRIDLYTPHYATGFRLLAAENSQSTMLEISNPWQGAHNVTSRLFIARNGESAPPNFDGQIVDERAERIVCMSSTQIAMLDAVGCDSLVVGVSGIEYISNEYIASQRESIVDVGYDSNVDYELIISLDPDIVLIYGTNSASTMEPKLRELSIPYAYIGEYLEESPLGKAEWMVAVAEIVGRREEGEERFSAIPQRYNALKESVADATTKPKVMINTPYGDSWVMAPRGSYVAQLIADAGGDYIYRSRGSSTRSESIDIEEAYLICSAADMWLNLGTLRSLEELRRQLPKFSDVPCVVSGEIYNPIKRSNPSGGNDYWESGVVHPDIVLRDLITIFHPEIISDTLHYYQRLK